MDLKEALQKAGLAEQRSSTNPDYVLTKRDEERALNNAKNEAMKFLVWRMKDKKCRPDQIEKRIRETDWDAKIDPAMVLDRANKFKAFQIWQMEERRSRENEKHEKARELAKQCDYKFFYTLMKSNCRRQTDPETKGPKELIENSDTLPLIKTICFFMSRDPRFETEMGYDPHKGLLIRGACGLGKTFLFQCVQHNPIRPVDITSALEIADGVRATGDFDLPIIRSHITYLDDVGTEEETIVFYGTRITYLRTFFERYYLQCPHGFNRLVISTNLSFEELEQKYGYRFRSRAKEMFNTIDVRGKDLRK